MGGDRDDHRCCSWLRLSGTGNTGFHAADLQVLSSIFLRMIKSLIAPLLFGTLVVGIAGHGDDLKRWGRSRSARCSTSRS